MLEEVPLADPDLHRGPVSTTEVILPRTFNPLSRGVTRVHNLYAAAIVIILFIFTIRFLTWRVDVGAERHQTLMMIWGIFSNTGLWLAYWLMLFAAKRRPRSMMIALIPPVMAIAAAIITSPFVLGY